MGRPFKGKEHPHPDKFGTIEMMAAVGIPTDDIAKLHHMTPQTLHKHYQDQLDLGMSKANAAVGGKIYKAAMKGEKWACSLWAARRMGWKDESKTKVELTGADGGPVQTETTLDVTKLSTAALEEILAQRGT